MPNVDYTTTALLSAIRRRYAVPNSATTGTTDADLLAYMNEEMKSVIVPLVMSVRQDYWTTVSDSTFSRTATSYAIPSRAIGQKLEEVQLLNSTGNVIMDLDRVERGELAEQERGYYLQNNAVYVLNPDQLTAATLRMTFFMRPSELVATTATVDTVTSVNINGTTVSVSWAGAPSLALYYDIVKGTPGFDLIAYDLRVDSFVNNGATGNITFTTTLPSGIAAGDYVCLAQQSPVPMCPPELHPVLVHAVCAALAEASGDQAGAEIFEGKVQALSEKAVNLLANRVEQDPQVVTPKNAIWRRFTPQF